MKYKYTAKILLGDKVIMSDSGDDLDQLFVWLVTEATEHKEFVNGVIYDNSNHKIIKRFHKSLPDD